MLGAMKRANKAPDLLYTITMHRPEQKINNVLQLSACILSQSRTIFLGKILTLLRIMDPRKAEICYYDTDSLCVAASSICFLDLLKREWVSTGPDLMRQLFEDPESEREQSGFFKASFFFTPTPWTGG